METVLRLEGEHQKLREGRDDALPLRWLMILVETPRRESGRMDAIAALVC